MKNVFKNIDDIGEPEYTKKLYLRDCIEIAELFDEYVNKTTEVETLLINLEAILTFQHTVLESGLDTGLVTLAIEHNYEHLFIDSNVSLQGFLDGIDNEDAVKEVMLNSIGGAIGIIFEKIVKFIKWVKDSIKNMLSKIGAFFKRIDIHVRKKNKYICDAIKEISKKDITNTNKVDFTKIVPAIDYFIDLYKRKPELAAFKKTNRSVALHTDPESIVKEMEILYKIKYGEITDIIKPFLEKIKRFDMNHAQGFSTTGVNFNNTNFIIQLQQLSLMVLSTNDGKIITKEVGHDNRYIVNDVIEILELYKKHFTPVDYNSKLSDDDALLKASDLFNKMADNINIEFKKIFTRYSNMSAIQEINVTSTMKEFEMCLHVGHNIIIFLAKRLNLHKNRIVGLSALIAEELQLMEK